jgi:hypothetical protein
MDFGDVAAVAAETRALIRRWKAAHKAMRRASVARAALGPHATRAKITSANARHHAAAEDFDRIDVGLREWAETVDPVDVDALRREVA